MSVCKSGKLSLAFNKAFSWPIFLAFTIFSVSVFVFACDDDFMALVDQIDFDDPFISAVASVGCCSGFLAVVIFAFVYFAYLLLSDALRPIFSKRK